MPATHFVKKINGARRRGPPEERPGGAAPPPQNLSTTNARDAGRHAPTPITTHEWWAWIFRRERRVVTNRVLFHNLQLAQLLVLDHFCCLSLVNDLCAIDTTFGGGLVLLSVRTNGVRGRRAPSAVSPSRRKPTLPRYRHVRRRRDATRSSATPTALWRAVTRRRRRSRKHCGITAFGGQPRPREWPLFLRNDALRRYGTTTGRCEWRGGDEQDLGPTCVTLTAGRATTLRTRRRRV